MFVPVFWILLWVVILSKWPALYFRNVWTVQKLCDGVAPNHAEKTFDSDCIRLIVLLPNGQRVRLQAHHTATIGEVVQTLHEYSDGYRISNTVLCLHDGGRTSAARPLQVAHRRLSSFLPTITGNFKACLRTSRAEKQVTTHKCCYECGWSSTEVDADQEVFCPHCSCECIDGPVHIPSLATCTHCMRDTQLCMHGPQSKYCPACSSPMIVQQAQSVFCDPTEHQTFHHAFQDMRWTRCTLPCGQRADTLIDYENPLWVLLPAMLMHLGHQGAVNPYSHISFFTPSRMVTFSLHEFGLNRHLPMKFRLASAGVNFHEVDCVAFHMTASGPNDSAPQCHHASSTATKHINPYNNDGAESGRTLMTDTEAANLLIAVRHTSYGIIRKWYSFWTTAVVFCIKPVLLLLTLFRCHEDPTGYFVSFFLFLDFHCTCPMRCGLLSSLLYTWLLQASLLDNFAVSIILGLICPVFGKGETSDSAAASSGRWEAAEENQLHYGFTPAVDESTAERLEEATRFLKPLNDILAKGNSGLHLNPQPVQGDGYCFFYVVAGSCGMDVSQEVAREIFACALDMSSKQYFRVHAESPFGDTETDRTMRIGELWKHPEFEAGLHRRTSFELAIMDKYESLISKAQVLDQRCYGDLWELIALLEQAQATAIKLDVTNNADHVLLPTKQPLASLEEIASKLEANEVDMVLLHWNELGRYEHYCTVMLPQECRVWTARENVQTTVQSLIRKSELALALQTSSSNARQTCAKLLSHLDFAGTLPDLPEIGLAECWNVFLKATGRGNNQMKRVILPKKLYSVNVDVPTAAATSSDVQRRLGEMFPAKTSDQIVLSGFSAQSTYGSELCSKATFKDSIASAAMACTKQSARGAFN